MQGLCKRIACTKNKCSAPHSSCIPATQATEDAARKLQASPRPCKTLRKGIPKQPAWQVYKYPLHMRNEITLRLRHDRESDHKKRSRGPAGHNRLRWPWPRAPRCLPHSASWFFHRMAPALLQLSSRPAAPTTTQPHSHKEQHSRAPAPPLSMRASLLPISVGCTHCSRHTTDQSAFQIQRAQGTPPLRLLAGKIKTRPQPIKREPWPGAPSGPAHCSTALEIQ